MSKYWVYTHDFLKYYGNVEKSKVSQTFKKKVYIKIRPEIKGMKLNVKSTKSQIFIKS